MDAVRVPPSAWRTSQSTVICTSPSATRSHTARSERAMSRWISWVRPDCLPLAASREARSGVEPGSIEYSAVTQPLPLPRIQGGTRSSTEAVHRTLVRPIDTSTEPGAKTVKSRWKETGRSSSRARPSLRLVRGSTVWSEVLSFTAGDPTNDGRGRSPGEDPPGQRLVNPGPERRFGLGRQRLGRYPRLTVGQH